MANKSSNKNLHKANAAKKDEFYTQLVDIEKELKHYKDQFRGKVVYCNCDDPNYTRLEPDFQSDKEFWCVGIGKKKIICYNKTYD